MSSPKKQRLRRSPAHSWTPTMPKMKKTKKQRRRTFPSIGRVSKRRVTRIRMPGRTKVKTSISKNWVCLCMWMTRADVSSSSLWQWNWTSGYDTIPRPPSISRACRNHFVPLAYIITSSDKTPGDSLTLSPPAPRDSSPSTSRRLALSVCVLCCRAGGFIIVRVRDPVPEVGVLEPCLTDGRVRSDNLIWWSCDEDTRTEFFMTFTNFNLSRVIFWQTSWENRIYVYFYRWGNCYVKCA